MNTDNVFPYVFFFLEAAKIIFVLKAFFGLSCHKRKLMVSLVITGLFYASIPQDHALNTLFCTVLLICGISLSLNRRNHVLLILLVYFFISNMDIISGIAFRSIPGLSVTNTLRLLINVPSFIVLLCIYMVAHKCHMLPLPLPNRSTYPFFLSGLFSVTLLIEIIYYYLRNDSWQDMHDLLTATAVLCSGIFIISCVFLMLLLNKTARLSYERELTQYQMHSQALYYQALLKKDDQVRNFHHEFRHHIFCMQSLIENEEINEARAYLSNLSDQFNENTSVINTGNHVVSSIISETLSRYPLVSICWRGHLPDSWSIPNTDLCIIFFNLIENACEAVADIPDAAIKIEAKMLENKLFISASNPYLYDFPVEDGLPVSTKSDAGHGFGIKNIKSCVEKNDGVFRWFTDKKVFFIEITLP